MEAEPLSLIATCDLVAVVRGRAVAARDLDAHLQTPFPEIRYFMRQHVCERGAQIVRRIGV